MDVYNLFILLPYLTSIYSLAMMAQFHNLIVSMILYKTRQTNVSNILKILFNFGGLLLYIGQTWYVIVPLDVTLNECMVVSYVVALGHVIHKSSLSAFLLWRLRQIENNIIDYWLGIVLFFLRFGFHFTEIFFIKPSMGHTDIPISQNYCTLGFEPASIELASALSFDLVIDLYVTLRLVRILNRANKNATQISSNITRKTKRTLFTAVMYWNFVRLIFAISYNVVILYFVVLGYHELYDGKISAISTTLEAALVIMLSYAITADAEIVRVIEGRKDTKGSSGGNSAGTGRSSKSTLKTPTKATHYRTSSEPPKYTAEEYGYSKNEKQESDNIGEDKIAVVSMKRLSFFEWANVVAGNIFVKKNNNNGDVTDEEKGEEVEKIEIVEASDDNFDHGNSSSNNNNNRGSSLSGTTTITATTSSSTIDEDIV